MDSQLTMHRASTGKVRREEVDGDPFLVVPMVALRTGVYQCANCEQPALYDAEVFARIPDSWNDRPITLGHPQREGLFVSAGSEDVWRKDGLGRVRNARRDGDKLVMEAWIDLTKADEVGDAASDLVDALEGGEQIDVSVGAFIDSVDHPGVHQGKTYGRRQLNYFPDHVALLPGQTGACSWEDGCGAPRVNAAAQENMMVLQASLPLETTTSACPCGGDGDDCTCEDGPKTAEILASSLGFSANVIGDVAKRQILNEALQQKLGDRWFVSVEVFEGSVVYQTSSGTFSRDFTLSEDGTVSLSDDPVQGALVAEFMPITVQQEGSMKERKEAVDGLIANEAAPWGEDDREFLMGAPEEQFATLASVTKPAAVEEFPRVDIEPAQPVQPAALSDAEREIMADALAVRERARSDLITRISANEANQFTADELGAMQTGQLQKLAALSLKDASEARPSGLASYAGAMPAAASTAPPQRMFAEPPRDPFAPKH